MEYFGPQANRLHMFEIFWQGTFPETTVEVVCRDGRVFSETLRGPKGHPRNNFTMAEEKEFFIARTAEFIGAETRRNSPTASRSSKTARTSTT